MPLDDIIRIRHIIEAAEEALSFCDGMSESDFLADRRTQRAVVQCIEVIGEAARMVSQPAREQLPTVPWHQIVGMRHRIVHVYFDIDLKLVWEVVARDLAPLIKALRASA
ncbi:MAG: HepT-like ribonuclease domain-containing protein [Phycisphaerales bacterium]